MSHNDSGRTFQINMIHGLFVSQIKYLIMACTPVLILGIYIRTRNVCNTQILGMMFILAGKSASIIHLVGQWV